MSTVTELGLRERKRRQTRRRIETAAVAIVDEVGLDALTIELISSRAEIAPRTFFNYFESKEDAILGLRTEAETRDTVDTAVETMPAGPLIEGVIELMLQASEGPGLDAELRERRRRILQAYPELLQRHFTRLERMLEPLSDGVQRLMARSGDDSPAHAGESSAQAEVLLMMCGAALRRATLDLSTAGADLTADEASVLLRNRAAALIRHTIESSR